MSKREWLETPHLLLRQPTLHDLEPLAQIYANPAIARYRTNPSPLNRDQTQHKLDAILNHWQQHQFGRWAIIDKPTQTFIGHAGLEMPPAEISTDPLEVELSYLIAQPHWGRGLATEASSVVLNDGFTRLGFRSIIALARPENQASIRVAEKLGMSYQSHHWLSESQWLRYQVRDRL